MTNHTQASTPTLAFIGAGNMATAMIRGLVAQGYPAARIWATNLTTEPLAQLAMQTGIHTTTDNDLACQQADLVVLAVKPQMMAEVLQTLRPALEFKRPLVLSIAAGLTSATLLEWIGTDLPLVRAMPNTPALLGAGATGLYAAAAVTAEQRTWVDRIASAMGQGFWVDEEAQIDAVTAISGSGPAYYFLFTEALAAAGQALGLRADLAQALAVQTAAGAGRMLAESGDAPALLRQKVTSPGGTTAAALACFEQQGLAELVEQAAQAAAQRAQQLADELSRPC
ncbi:pyrroline-5-carboxylate reductase [Marinospirillum sp. MEB164]|uniref:Pyrroline-5-carboxylate reductase n=1 Tax=Marinospirillum alkalitolerans TaxID=3123374 RepID=A0ABW8PVR6_9GAMM